METSPLEAQILEIMLSEPLEEVTVYSLLKKGIPQASAHQALKRLEEKGLALSRREQIKTYRRYKKVYTPTSQGREIGSRLHVPKEGEMSFPSRWQNWNQGRFGAAFTNVGEGEARGYIISNYGTTQRVSMPAMESMVTSLTTTESFRFEATSGRPVIQLDPLCRKCGGKLSSMGRRMYCSHCDGTF